MLTGSTNNNKEKTMLSKVNNEQSLAGVQNYSAIVESILVSSLPDSEQVLSDFNAKYSINLGGNRLWKSEVAKASPPYGPIIERVDKNIDRAIEREKKDLERVEKQNRETNQNVEHINRELDRIGKEAQDKGSKK